jgi:hypothetical protein
MFESRMAEPVLRTGIGTDTLGPIILLEVVTLKALSCSGDECVDQYLKADYSNG